jgi:hypothetical protein
LACGPAGAHPRRAISFLGQGKVSRPAFLTLWPFFGIKLENSENTSASGGYDVLIAFMGRNFTLSDPGSFSNVYLAQSPADAFQLG